MIDSIYLQYRFAEKDNRWGLQDQQGNWVVAPQYYDYYNSYDVLPDGDVYFFPDNMYIFEHIDNEGRENYYLYNEKLVNLYPEGVLFFEDFDSDFKINQDNCNEYIFVVKGINGLYGLSYSFINNGALTTLPSGLVEGHLNTEWEKIFNLTDWGFDLIKEDKLYYLDLFFGRNTISEVNKIYPYIPPNNFNDLLNEFPVIEFPDCLETLGAKRFMIELYYSYFEWSHVYYIQGKSKVKEMKYCFPDTATWLYKFAKKDKLPLDLLGWIFLKLFYPNFNGKTISKNIKKQLLELDKH